MVVSQTTSITPATHAASHQPGGTDPFLHAAAHVHGGGDAVIGDVRIDSLYETFAPVTLLGSSYKSIIQGTWVTQYNNVFPFNIIERNTSHVDGDGLRWKAHLSAGTYTLRSYLRLDSNCGIIDFKIDGSVVASIDNYNGAGQMMVRVDTGITVATSGDYDIDAVINGKNAGSSDYTMNLAAFVLTRTA